MPRFTGGAVGALAYDAVSAFETTVPLPERDPVGVPTAAFIETDLVLVFDHLTHTLSAIASLHTDAPDLEGRYRIAEAAIFEALERTARPSAAEMAGRGRRRSGERPAAPRPPRRRRRPVETSLGRDEYIHAVEVAKDAIAAGEAIQVVLARRQSFDLPADPRPDAPLDGIGLYRVAPPGQPEPVPVLRPDAVVRGRRRVARSSCSRSRATASRPTRSPARGRAARTPARTRSSPSSSSATRRSGPST